MNRHAFASLLALLLGAAGGCAHVSPAPPEPGARYSVIAKYAIGGTGGWDFISADAKGHRLYVSRGDHVQVVDTLSGALVGDLTGTAGVHGIAIAADLGLGFTSNGRSDSVTVFDLSTLAALDTIATSGSNPDAILYEPSSRRILTFNGRSANATVIDATTRKVVATVTLPGKPEVAVADGKGLVFVNIEDRNSVVVIEMASLAASKEWRLGSCEEPTGLAIDAARGRLFSVCHNRRMIVVDSGSGEVLQELPIGADVDGAEFDPQLGLVFSSNGDGTLTVVRYDSSGRYTVADTIATQSRARTIALDPVTHRIYLPTASFAPPAAATPDNPKPRATQVPGSFVIVVLAPGAAR